MTLSMDSTLAELRNEIRRKQDRALELQANTTDAVEWSSLNTLRWELDDLDKSLYLNQFIQNNDTLEKLTREIRRTNDAKRINETLERVKKAISVARAKLQKTSSMIGELNQFFEETKSLIEKI